MDLVKHTAQLDLTDNGCFDTGWRIKQGDYGNSQLMISLVDNGVNAFDAEVTPQINFKRPDGKSVIADMTVEQNVYSYIFAGNELELAGTVLMDVKFITPQGRTSSASCKFTCVEDTIGIDPTGASTYYNPVAEVIEEAKAIAEEVGGFTEAITDLQQNKQNKLIAGRNITIDEETNTISASGGGGGGSNVVANPTLAGDEEGLFGIEVEGTKYKVAEVKELSKATYDSLPDSKLTDGKMYFINDWSQSGSDESKIYDGNEHVIGSWFGKPLYRKVLSVNVNFAKTTNWTNVISVADLNMNKLINIRALNLDDKGGVYQTPDFRVTAAGMIQYYIAVSSSWNVRYLIIEYTKTTD